ncbi:MAG: prepilin-type N-terminal cleavage/methylation domain-containing protein [Pseudomonadota bacterium]
MIQKLRNKQGFTLIELMIVIAIIGILAAIAIPNFISYRNKAYCSYAESDAQNVMAAISCYFAEPDHITLGSDELSTLQNDSICRVTLSGDNSGDVTEDATNRVFTIAITDGSNRCPRSNNASTKIYTTYMGSSTKGFWN